MFKINEKENEFKAARKKDTINKKTKVKITADLSLETTQMRRKWSNSFKVLKEKNGQSRILYPTKITFKNKAKVKISSDTKA